MNEKTKEQLKKKKRKKALFLLPPVHFLFPFPTQIPSRI